MNSSVNELHVLLVYLEIVSGAVWSTHSLQSNLILQLQVVIEVQEKLKWGFWFFFQV